MRYGLGVLLLAVSFGWTAAAMPIVQVTANDAFVFEDGSVVQRIEADVQGGSSSDFLALSIDGIPSSWSVDTSSSGGTYDPGSGVWEITLAPGVFSYSDGPTVSPPADSDVDLTSILATGTVFSSSGTVHDSDQTTFNTTVDAVGDRPNLILGDVSGTVNQTIALMIQTSVADTDGSEEIA